MAIHLQYTTALWHQQCTKTLARTVCETKPYSFINFRRQSQPAAQQVWNSTGFARLQRKKPRNDTTMTGNVKLDAFHKGKCRFNPKEFRTSQFLREGNRGQKKREQTQSCKSGKDWFRNGPAWQTPHPAISPISEMRPTFCSPGKHRPV